MKVTIKATNLSLTPEIEKTIKEKIANLDKFIPHIDTSIESWVEVGISTRHHHKGDIYRAEVDIRLPHKILRAEAERKSLDLAIGEVKDELQQKLKKYKGRYQALVKRRAMRIKRFKGKKGRIREEGI